jgi:hypothetical protein
MGLREIKYDQTDLGVNADILKKNGRFMKDKKNTG